MFLPVECQIIIGVFAWGFWAPSSSYCSLKSNWSQTFMSFKEHQLTRASHISAHDLILRSSILMTFTVYHILYSHQSFILLLKIKMQLGELDSVPPKQIYATRFMIHFLSVINEQLCDNILKKEGKKEYLDKTVMGSPTVLHCQVIRCR